MRSGNEIVWRLKGESPDTIPMARLAEYMHQLSILLGSQADLRFVKIERGSLNLHAATVGGGTAGQVRKRIDAVRRRAAPADAMRAFHRINQMVTEDRGPARLVGPATVLHFPGAAPASAAQMRVNDYGSIVGRLYVLGEARSGITARIKPVHGDGYISCTASSSVGRLLRQHLFESVRAFGLGVWAESESGPWTCESMAIDRVVPVQNVGLRDAIDSLRAVSIGWPDDPIGDMYALNNAS